MVARLHGLAGFHRRPASRRLLHTDLPDGTG
jgi:hypothetical protein